jgi:DNA-directed RNA polymerase specialized sigma subunit
MPEADLTEGCPGRELCYAGDGWRPLAQQLTARFAAAGGSDEGMIRAATEVILEAERRLGPRGPERSSLVVRQVIRALRRHRRERLQTWPLSAPALPVAIAAAESELLISLRRSPTIEDVANHLQVSEHQIIAGLEAGWSVGPAGATAG